MECQIDWVIDRNGDDVRRRQINIWRRKDGVLCIVYEKRRVATHRLADRQTKSYDHTLLLLQIKLMAIN